MARRPKYELSELERMAIRRQSGLKPFRDPVNSCDVMEDLEDRITTILGMLDSPSNATDMLFFVMYDISDSRVRRYVVKYLINKGCHRVQKSIFLANISPEKFHTIKEDLTKVQACYENADSIFLVPVSTDHLKNMSVIGKDVNMEIILRNKSTMFF